MIETLNDLQLLRIDGAATVEDAEQVLNTLVAHPDWRVDLRGCSHLHAAVLQTLMCLRPSLWLPSPPSPVAVLVQAGRAETAHREQPRGAGACRNWPPS